MCIIIVLIVSGPRIREVCDGLAHGEQCRGQDVPLAEDAAQDDPDEKHEGSREDGRHLVLYKQTTALAATRVRGGRDVHSVGLRAG